MTFTLQPNLKPSQKAESEVFASHFTQSTKSRTMTKRGGGGGGGCGQAQKKIA
jgi:hypothetical protein